MGFATEHKYCSRWTNFNLSFSAVFRVKRDQYAGTLLLYNWVWMHWCSCGAKLWQQCGSKSIFLLDILKSIYFLTILKLDIGSFMRGTYKKSPCIARLVSNCEIIKLFSRKSFIFVLNLAEITFYMFLLIHWQYASSIKIRCCFWCDLKNKNINKSIIILSSRWT